MNLANIQPAESLMALTRQLQQTIARINTVFSKEHTAAGAHLLPAWIPVTAGASDFTGTGAQTWTVVVATQVLTLAYWKHGDGMTVSFEIAASTVGGAAAAFVSMKIPGGFTAKHMMRTWVYLTNAGAYVSGMAVVLANSRTIDIYRTDIGNFAAGACDVRGQIQFRTTA